MADNPMKRGVPDSKTISMKERWEWEYWKDTLGVSGRQLAGAVRVAGKSVEKVKKYLGSK